jgi:hypothetical protein
VLTLPARCAERSGDLFGIGRRCCGEPCFRGSRRACGVSGDGATVQILTVAVPLFRCSAVPLCRCASGRKFNHAALEARWALAQRFMRQHCMTSVAQVASSAIGTEGTTVQGIEVADIVCTTTFEDTSVFVDSTVSASQAAHASTEGDTAICVVAPPPVFANTTATTATLAVASRHAGENQDSNAVMFIMAPVPVAASLRNTIDEGEHVEVALERAWGLHQVGPTFRLRHVQWQCSCSPALAAFSIVATDLHVYCLA